MAITSTNPATGEVIRKFESLSDEEIEGKLQRATDSFRSFRSLPFPKRAAMMLRAAEILEAEKRELGRTMTLEMGKPIRAAIQEAEKCALGCRYYAKHAERFLRDEAAPTDAEHSFVRFQPIGPVLAIMPWNFPFWQVFRFAAPSLMAGNVALLKHASNVPQCSLAIEDIFRRAGFPDGVFQSLLIGVDKVETILGDSRVMAATLTGSVAAGASIAGVAGRKIKKTVLELGGSDPFVVMPSADLKAAIATAVQARVINNGQSCIAAKRFIVAESIADEFTRGFVEQMGKLRIGDPMDESIEVGPLALSSVLSDLEEQVNKTVQMGARILLGGRRLPGKGNFYAPTVLSDIPDGSPAQRGELFGPVASIFRARDAEDAVRIANDSPFGLGSSVWTNDQAEREFFIDEIQAGMVFVNAMVVSDPRIPFGGVKESGYGRELSSYGIREFVNIKTVSIHKDRGVRGSGTE